MLRRVPLHPVLVAVLPVLVLWAANRSEVVPGDALPVVAEVVAATLVVGLVAAAAWRDVRRGALAASALAGIALTHGHLWGIDGSTRVVPGLLVASVVAVAALVRLHRMDDDELGRVTRVVNAATLVLVLLPLPLVATTFASPPAGPTTEVADPDPDDADGPDGPDIALPEPDGDRQQRDVVWIVPDRHGSVAGLQSTFGFDAAPFTDELRDRGFAVAEQARSNYPKTAHSLAAMLNLTYLDEVAATVPAGQRDSWATLYAMLEDHEVGRLFTAAGYEYWHLGNWWNPTNDAVDATQVLTLGAGGGLDSEFAQVFDATTVLPALRSALGRDATSGRLDEDALAADTSYRGRHVAHNVWGLEQLDRVARDIARDDGDAPRFVLAHLALPHEPYVFDRDGSIVDPEVAAGRTRAENFERQLAYLDDQLLEVVRTLTDVPADRAPIVLVQADEGPHPAELERVGDDDYPWGEAGDAELATKFQVLSALYVPGADPTTLLPQDVTGVNVARLLVDAALGTDLPELPDRSYVFPTPDDLYDFTDVTGRLDAATR